MDREVKEVTTFQQREDNEDPVSYEVHFWIRFILPSVSTAVLFLFGAPANVLCALVFYKQSLKERINVCLFALALSDFIAVSVEFLLVAEQAYRSLIGPSGVLLETLVGVTGFYFASQFLSCVIACERCFCVVSPFKAQKYLKTSTMAAIVTVSCVVIVGGVCVVDGYKHTVAFTVDPATNKTVSVFGYTKFYLEHRQVFDAIDIFFYSDAFPVLILIVIICTTSLTVHRIYIAASWRITASKATDAERSASAKRESTDLPSREITLTKMLVATSVYFIACLLPNIVYQLAVFVVPGFSYSGKYYKLYGVLWEFIALFRLMNCSLNFIIYYRMGSKFRATVHEIVSVCGTEKPCNNNVQKLSSGMVTTNVFQTC